MVLSLIISALVAFFVVLAFTPRFIKFLRKIGLIVQDQNKEGKPLVPISGGMLVACGFVAGLLTFIFFRTFFNAGAFLRLDDSSLNLLFAGMISIFLITIIGFFDDLLIKADKSSSFGLRQWQKPLLTLVAAVPLMVVNAGIKTMTLPLIGYVDVGYLYPLLFVPIGVIGAANMVNMLAGYNGMEAGMGLVYFGMLGAYSYYHKSYLAALIAFVAFGAVLAFFYFNKFPAKILPGDSFTYMLGGILAVVVIVGDFEKAGLVIAIPFFVEFFLKLRGRFKKQSYGKFENGKLVALENKVYSIPHLFTRTGRFSERQVTYFMILIQLVFSSLIWLI